MPSSAQFLAVLMVAACLSSLPIVASASPLHGIDEPRGKLLYEAHCRSCHDTEVHWRDGKLAKNWNGLRYQITRWQNTLELPWSEDDATNVARYLNAAYYHYPISLTKAYSRDEHPKDQ